MHKTMKRFVAALTGLAMALAPVTAWAEEAGGCPLFVQVESDATGGNYVAGLLVNSVTREVNTNSTTVTSGSTSIGGSIGTTTNNANGSVSGSWTNTTTVITSESQIVGYYKMNDGSSWEVNCTTGDAKQR